MFMNAKLCGCLRFCVVFLIIILNIQQLFEILILLIDIAGDPIYILDDPKRDPDPKVEKHLVIGPYRDNP